MVTSNNNSRFKSSWVLALFFGLTAIFLFPIFLGKTFFPGDLLYQWPPWFLSDAKVIKDVLPINNPLLGDAVTAFYPWYTYLSQSMTTGALPLWNPLILAGAPLLANWQSGALAIENIVFYFFETPIALNIQVFFKVFMALSFSYLFLRKLNLSREASIFGAVSYAFSAFFVVWLNWPQTRVAVWLPLILFTIEHLFEQPNIKRTAFVALAIGAAVLAGHPGTMVQVMMIVALYTAIRLFSLDKQKIKFGLYVLGGVILGLGLGAALIIPGYEMMKESYQYGQRSATDYLKLGLGPGNLVLLFFPNFYGHLKDGLYKGPANFNEVSAYVGILPLLFSFWALAFVNKLKKVWPFIALALFSTVMIYSLWPQSLLAKLPLVAMQPTQRYIFILTFALSTIGAFGFDAFFKDDKRKGRFVVLGAIFVGAMALTFYKLQPTVWSVYKSQYFLLSLPFLAMLGVYVKKGVAQLKWLLVLLLVVDMFMFGIKLNSYVKTEYAYPKTAVTDFINKDKSVKRVLPLVDTMLPNSLMPYGIQDLRGRDALISKRFYKFSKLINDKDKPPQLPNFILPNRIDSDLIDFLNVKYIISEIPVENTLPERLISSNGFSEVYKGQSQAQTFVAGKDKLAGIGVLVGTFKRTQNPTSLDFKITDSEGKVIRSKKVKAAYFRDNSYYFVDFKPIPDSKNKRYKLTIEGSDVPKEFRTAIYISTFDQYSGGKHLSNGKDQAGDLVFFLQYQRPLLKFKQVFKYKNLKVYENKKAFPRAYAVDAHLVIKDDEEALTRLEEKKIDLRKQVILNKEPLYTGSSNISKSSTEKTEIKSYKPNNIEIDVSLNKKKMIVVSDNYYPGWNAYIDGKKAPLYIANTTFRAVALNKGDHRLELKYQPTSFRNGLLVSFSSLFLVLGMIITASIRRKDDD